MAWVLTKGLQNLRGQVDRAFPWRDKGSDGTVGDLAHQTGSSGHNPDLTGKAEYKDGDSLDEVRAWDMDTDLAAAGVTAQQVVDHIRRLPGVASVLRYIIFNRKIYQAPAFAAEDYDGPSPHTEHIHFSGARTQPADNDTSFDYRLGELTGGDDMLVKKGDSGEEVKGYQFLLNDLGFSVGEVDGDYGPKMEAAVNAHRAKYGQGPNPAISGWHWFILQRDLVMRYAGRDGAPGKQGPPGKDGAPGRDGAPGKDGQFSGALTVTGGQLTVETVA